MPRSHDLPQDLETEDIVGDNSVTDRSCAVVYEPWEGARIIRIEDLEEDEEPEDATGGPLIHTPFGDVATAGPPDGPPTWEQQSPSQQSQLAGAGWNRDKWNTVLWTKSPKGWTYSEGPQAWLDANGKQILGYIGTALTVASGIVSFIPGVGTAAGVVLGAAGALASGAPIDDIAISAAAGAVPGGALAKTAFMAGAHATVAIAEGKPIDGIALEAARGALESSGLTGSQLDAALAAFDAGAALAQGKALQEAGFAAVKDLVPGDGLGAQVVSFSERAAKAIQKGQSVESYLEDEAAADLKAALPELASMTEKPLASVAAALPTTIANLTSSLMSQIARNPDMANWSSQDIANALDVPEPAARIAKALIDVAGGKVSIDQDRYNSLLGKLKPVSVTQTATRSIASNATLNQQHGIFAALGGNVSFQNANPLRISAMTTTTRSPAQTAAAAHMTVARAIAGDATSQARIANALSAARDGHPVAQQDADALARALKAQQREAHVQYYLALKAKRMTSVQRQVAKDQASGWYHYSGAYDITGAMTRRRSTFGVG